MMAGESKCEVQEVVLSEDDNSQDGSRASIIRKKPEKKRRYPPINIPEKIILCLDVTPACSKLALFPDKEVEPLLVLKQSILIFIHNKLSQNSQTEIAVVLLNGSSVYLYLQFTNDKQRIIERIKRINVPGGGEDMEAIPEEPYSLDELFKTLAEYLKLPVCEQTNLHPTSVLPAYIVRCILFYSRAKLLSYSPSTEYFNKLFTSRYFIFDSVFLHDADLDDDIRKDIVLALAELDSGYSYILESDNNTINFMNAFSLLASHPFQRPHQSEINHEIVFYKKLLLS